MDYQGTISRGIRAPIIKQGDDLVKITADCVVNASIEHGFPLNDKDVVAVTVPEEVLYNSIDYYSIYCYDKTEYDFEDIIKIVNSKI